MRNWILIPLLSMSLSLPAMAKQKVYLQPYKREPILLTYEQFSHLTHAEQKTYVKKLREIMIEVAKAYPEVAEEWSARSGFYALLWNTAVANVMGEDAADDSRGGKLDVIAYFNDQAQELANQIDKAKTANMKPEEKKALAAQYSEALKWSANAAYLAHTLQNPTAREEVLKELENLKTRLENQETKVKSVAGESDYKEARDEYFKKAFKGEIAQGTNFPVGSLKIDNAKFQAFVEARQKSKSSPQNKSQPAVRAQATADKKKDPSANKKVDGKKQPEAAKPDVAKSEGPKPDTAEPENQTAENKDSDTPAGPPVGQLYRCMYAGFVISQHPCLAPSQLPWHLNGLDESKFVCADGTVMCNPFLFGYKSNCDLKKLTTSNQIEACQASAEPYCVKPGLYATKNCGELSNNDASLENAVQLITSNGEAFNSYSKSFDDLCLKGLINFNSYKGQSKNKARIQADITRTCDVAKERLKEIKKRYNLLDGSAKPSEPSTQAPDANSGAK